MAHKATLSLTALQATQKRTSSSTTVLDDPDKSYVDYSYDEPGSIPGSLYNLLRFL